ncbi:MAG: hypothetical protein QG623_411 [Patescibacteria group bacterium]|nr:hypothetical protein [Patescibacteria group bacterium]
MNNKADKPLVSIIIPTYKGSTTLARAIMSCLGQSYMPTEIIIVDDNDPKSTERYKTESIVKNYENLGNVIYIKHSKNRNGSAARNTGF